MGICFIPIGIASIGLLPLGIIFLLVGLRNKDKWEKETKWADFPPRLKKNQTHICGWIDNTVISSNSIFYIFESKLILQIAS